MKYVSFKNIFDFSFALVSIIVVAPLFILIFFTNLIILGKPIFFKQERPGYREKLFKIIKFRTMSNTNFSSTDFERMNSYGKWLRSTSLDELPELINILRGEMSFIGPRPLLKKYIPLYSIEQSKRHLVKPGFSGWAQINGRNNTSWEKRLKLDVWYVENQSFLIDLKIFFITIWKVIIREGINSRNHSTMEEFKGTKK